MNKTRIISTVITVCFVSLTTYAQNITETTQTDSLSIDSFYETLPEVMITGERPIVKLDKGKLSYNMPILLERIPADNAFDALKNIPGINVQNENVNFAGQSLTLIIDSEFFKLLYLKVVNI